MKASSLVRNEACTANWTMMLSNRIFGQVKSITIISSKEIWLHSTQTFSKYSIKVERIIR